MTVKATVPEWGHTPVEPFAVGSSVYANAATGRSLDDAMRFFVDNFLPGQYDRRVSAWITDAHRAIVLGWMYNPDQPVLWYGCEKAYRVFEKHHDPLAVLCHELVASGVVPRIEDEHAPH